MTLHSKSFDNGLVLDRRFFLKGAACIAGATYLSGCAAAQLASGNQKQYNAIHPGEVWLDTNGKPIQAHAGSLIEDNGVYYWYGENKEFTDGTTDIESWGIRFYRSTDLYNWEDLGAVIPPNETDDESPLSYKVFPERPHILKHPKTGQYICWLKIRGMGPQFRTVLVADEITGPYTMVHKKIQPLGMHAGDFDFVVDEDTHTAYMYFEHEHKEIICIELNDDWTDITDKYSRHFPRNPPFSREAPALFKHNSKLYMATSGLSGYFPNPSEIAVAEDYHGPFKTLGIMHPNDQSETSYASQISDIFKVPGKENLYIALADRWFPDVVDKPKFASGELSNLVRTGIEKAMSKPRKPLSGEERQALMYSSRLHNVNTSISRYVWLPISLDGPYPTIKWHGQWRISDYD